MIKLHEGGVYLVDGQLVPAAQAQGDPRLQDATPQQAKKATIAYSILQAHNHSGDPASFDALASHDITYVGIIQTARASGMEKFPMPYVLTCCHNSLCAVGGTINEDDHMFGLTAAQKYGGIYVPANQSVIHSYAREELAGCGKMILGSDSHTRYGALGTMAVGEGGGELDKQILGDTWDSPYPEVVAIYLTGNTAMNPAWMADFASSHGYASDGSGSYWTLFSEGGASLGFDVTEIPLDEQRIIDNLEVGNPIVAVVGPGDFTTTGHFIVLTGYQDGQIKVNDPNSQKNSKKLWDYDRISGQIKDLWVFR